MRKRVVVTGLGCLSPLGNSVTETWEAVAAGRSGIGPITSFDTSPLKTKIAGAVKGFDAPEQFGSKDARRLDRFSQFALAATYQALADANFTVDESNRDRVGIVIGSGIGGITTILEQVEVMRSRGPDRVSPFLIPMMIPDGAAGAIAIHIGARGPNMAISTACATGSNCIGEAGEMIRRGAADMIIAGGSESPILAIAMAGLNVMTALSTRNDEPEKASRPFDRNRDGFVIGEGAGVLILESLDHAQARGANILCELTGYGTSDDAHHISAPAEDGAGAKICIQLALQDAGLRPEDIDYINAHGTSTYLNDKSETAAIKGVFGEQAYNVPISSTKSMTGHLLGASGAVEAVICAQVLQHKLLPPTINYETPDPECDLDYIPNQARPSDARHVMSNSFGFGGHNATLIFSRFEGNHT
jgi:3-oxoacyl-[acyl-carrier-protein] synthase II